jgi:hypothetical protein
MNPVVGKWFPWILAGAWCCAMPGQAGHGTVPGQAAAEAFFASTNLASFQVELGPAEYQQLLRQPRGYVSARVRVGDRVFEQVGVRLKGSGTFQPISRHPSLALKFNWKLPNQEFEGLTKLFLNNSGQDATMLCELMASGAFTDAHIPVPRITHAHLKLNGRDLGVHVLAEPVNKRFLKRQFDDARGNLYEGEFRDINSRLEQDNGIPGDQTDLKRLFAAAAIDDPAKRRVALAEVLDIDQFLNFLAVEMMVSNWDGYALHQNNYRIYRVPNSGRMVLIPHGSDNTFFESGLSLMPPRSAVLVAALLDSPEERKQFRQRVANLLPIIFEPAKVSARLEAGIARLRQGTLPADREMMEKRCALFRQRLDERVAHLRAELAGAKPKAPEFDEHGIALLQGWCAKQDWNHSPVDKLEAEGRALLAVSATNGFCFGSWRLPIWLPAGTYRFEASARTSDVVGLPSRTGSGAGVRVLGNSRGSGLQGTFDWTPVQHEFQVQPDCEWSELIVELRAYRGVVQFAPETLRLVRIGE